MCGFAGFLDLDAATNADSLAATVSAMADTLAHRGPDDSGVWCDAEAGVALGHRRLAIVDLSAAGHQPMISACGRYVTAFNGEIYNFRELRGELESGGFTGFRGHSDTEVLLAAVARWGVMGALRRCTGMFAFAMWDRQERRLHLARDRMGEKPLYYGLMGRFFVFGSELKALRKHRAFVGEVDRNVLALYLRHNYVPAPYSIFAGVRKLTPGTFLTASALEGVGKPEPYWSLRECVERGHDNPFSGTREDAVDEVDRLLRQSVSKQMLADVPVGAFLSGGIDSSTVVALMQDLARRRVKTFTIGFAQREFSEASHARAVAVHLGTEHHEFEIGPKDALDVVPRLPEIYDEPFADSSQIPTCLVAALCRQHVTVSLSGDGGDELFHGYRRYADAGRLWGIVGRLPLSARRSLARVAGLVTARQWDAIRRSLPLIGGRIPQGATWDRLLAILRQPAFPRVYQLAVSQFADPEGLVLGGREPPYLFTRPEVWPDGVGCGRAMMFADSLSYLPDDILVKVDRAAMAVSLESRVPLLDHRLVEFTQSLPWEMLRGEQKGILKQLLQRHVPREMFERPKMGFGVPLDQWLRGPLRDWAESLLDVARLREDGFFAEDPIREIWETHIGGRASHGYSLWVILMFQAWFESHSS